MSSSAASGPDNALHLVQLKQLVENVAESANRGLQDLSQAVPALSDEERYRLDTGASMHMHITISVISSMTTVAAISTGQISKAVSGAQEACSFAAPARDPTEALAPACPCGVVQQSKSTVQGHVLPAYPILADLYAAHKSVLSCPQTSKQGRHIDRFEKLCNTVSRQWPQKRLARCSPRQATTQMPLESQRISCTT